MATFVALLLAGLEDVVAVVVQYPSLCPGPARPEQTDPNPIPGFPEFVPLVALAGAVFAVVEFQVDNSKQIRKGPDQTEKLDHPLEANSVFALAFVA